MTQPCVEHAAILLVDAVLHGIQRVEHEQPGGLGRQGGEEPCCGPLIEELPQTPVGACGGQRQQTRRLG